MIDRAKFLLFVGICCMGAVPANANCPVDSNPPECPAFPLAPPYFPHEDCNFFYQCSNGIAYCLQCPEGLYFNPTLYVCDWPWNVECKADGGGSEEDGTTEEGDSEEGGTDEEDGTAIEGDGSGGGDGTIVEGSGGDGGDVGSSGVAIEPW